MDQMSFARTEVFVVVEWKKTHALPTWLAVVPEVKVGLEAKVDPLDLEEEEDRCHPRLALEAEEVLAVNSRLHHLQEESNHLHLAAAEEEELEDRDPKDQKQAAEAVALSHSRPWSM